jgi:hypothetical protein
MLCMVAKMAVCVSSVGVGGCVNLCVGGGSVGVYGAGEWVQVLMEKKMVLT